ncbi:MAG TPA: hypothetical protein VMG59_06345 [Phycisphaerae bacterium]|nr:hypothetical protein [Phycisphaerae bacterium]
MNRRVFFLLPGPLALIFAAFVVRGQSLDSLLQNAPPATAPSANFSPDQNLHPFANTNSPDALEIRTGTVELSNSQVISGKIWTTVDTPFRVWIDDLKQYRDLDIRLVKQITVQPPSAQEIDQWRWQQEGSDIQLKSGKTEPFLKFTYTFTMLDGEKVTGTVEAPLFVQNAQQTYQMLIYKQIQGKLGESIDQVVYVKQVNLTVTPEILKFASQLTETLPILDWRKILAESGATP